MVLRLNPALSVDLCLYPEPNLYPARALTQTVLTVTNFYTSSEHHPDSELGQAHGNGVEEGLGFRTSYAGRSRELLSRQLVTRLIWCLVGKGPS